MAQRANNDDHVADIDKWVVSLTRMLEDVPQYMCTPGHRGRVSRIPTNLREADLKAYQPYFLSIGPYYHGNPKLRYMEKRKQAVLKYFLQEKSVLTLKDYLKEIKNIEATARSFYSDVEMESEKFVKMLLLDSMFILAMFCGMPQNRRTKRVGSKVDEEDNDEEGNKENDTVIAEDNNSNATMLADELIEDTWIEETTRMRLQSVLIVHDLFLLENQLPFFVLQKMFVLAYGGREAQLQGIMKVVAGYMLTDYIKMEPEKLISPTTEVHHFLHLCHMFFRPLIQEEPTSCQLSESGQMFRLGSAMQLHEAGVSFVARSSTPEHSLLDITFCSSGKMVMPCLHVDDNTNSLLRNLIALEQMKYPSLGLNVSAYAVLLLHLITTPEDARLLRRKGIIQHHLASDKEMMYLVNRLSVGLAFDYVEDKYSLKPVFQELKAYSQQKVTRWKAWLKHRHCSNPWLAISLFAASLLMLLTILQTFYTVYSYYRP